jgi:hypothetical protein
MLPGSLEFIEAARYPSIALIITLFWELAFAVWVTVLPALLLVGLVAGFLRVFELVHPAVGVPLWNRVHSFSKTFTDPDAGHLPRRAALLFAFYASLGAAFTWFTLLDFSPKKVGPGMVVYGIFAALVGALIWVGVSPNVVARTIKFFLWGWVRTKWGLRLLTAGSGLLWATVFAQNFASPVKIVAATAALLLGLYMLGKALSKLHKFLRARGFTRTKENLEGIIGGGAFVIFLITTGHFSQSGYPGLVIFASGFSLLAPMALGWGLPPLPKPARKYGDAEVVGDDVLKAKGIVDER